MSGEATKGKRRSLELSALPRLTVPSKNRSTSATNSYLAYPHALTVDFQYLSGDGVSPCSETAASSRCSVVSLSPSLFPLPPGATPPTTSHSETPCLDTPPRTSRSQKSVNSWFSPPSPPPTSPLPPTPAQRRMASLIAATNGLESLQVPECAKIKSSSIEAPELIPSYPLETPMTPPRRQRSYTVDSRGIRESAVDPDAPLSPLRSSLPPPYSPGMCTPERFSNISNTSIPNSRVDSTTPLVYNPTDPLGTPPHSPATESDRRKTRGDAEAGGATGWRTGPKRRKRKIMMTVVGAAGAALMMIIAGVAVGVYLAVTGSAAL
ncbi:hypothetical protein F4781DRAFT_436234 [Annulohypoxylon bovei var. microspora]|nr:hypothetical protein F4781DRAFT_436234 [Annulohypoxylon bovei var. microspora]